MRKKLILKLETKFQIRTIKEAIKITPLHSAAQCGYVKVCRLIMETLVDKNPGNNDGVTPLHSAAHCGHLDVCKLICKNIAEKNPIDNFGQTPISVVRARGNMDIVSFFESL